MKDFKNKGDDISELIKSEARNIESANDYKKVLENIKTNLTIEIDEKTFIFGYKHPRIPGLLMDKPLMNGRVDITARFLYIVYANTYLNIKSNYYLSIDQTTFKRLIKNLDGKYSIKQDSTPITDGVVYLGMNEGFFDNFIRFSRSASGTTNNITNPINPIGILTNRPIIGNTNLGLQETTLLWDNRLNDFIRSLKPNDKIFFIANNEYYLFDEIKNGVSNCRKLIFKDGICFSDMTKVYQFKI